MIRRNRLGLVTSEPGGGDEGGGSGGGSVYIPLPSLPSTGAVVITTPAPPPGGIGGGIENALAQYIDRAANAGTLTWDLPPNPDDGTVFAPLTLASNLARAWWAYYHEVPTYQQFMSWNRRAAIGERIPVNEYGIEIPADQAAQYASPVVWVDPESGGGTNSYVTVNGNPIAWGVGANADPNANPSQFTTPANSYGLTDVQIPVTTTVAPPSYSNPTTVAHFSPAPNAPAPAPTYYQNVAPPAAAGGPGLVSPVPTPAPAPGNTGIVPPPPALDSKTLMLALGAAALLLSN
jgi:hypothetical protein